MRIARTRVESRAATKARSTAAPKRLPASFSLVKACSTRTAPISLGRIGGGIGERVLRGARAPAHRAAEAVERQHDDRNGAEHEERQPRARHHHHGGGADEQHEVAQRDRDRGADRSLDLGGVGGEPRDQLAGLGLIEIGGGERDDVAEHVAAQIGDDALAQRGDEVVARALGSASTATTAIMTVK